MMQTFNVTFSAGETKPFGIPGRFFRILAGDNAVDLKFYKNGGLIGSASDVDAGFAWEGGKNTAGGSLFDRVDITGVGGSVKFAISDDPVSYDRMNGIVSVISGEMARVKAGVAFMSHGSAAAGVGNYLTLQLWNPPTSGKRVIVTRLSVSTLAAANIIVRYGAAAKASQQTGQPNPKSKRLGGADSVMENRYLIDTTQPLYQGFLLSSYTNGAAAVRVIEFREPLVVDPGVGLEVLSLGADATIYMDAEFFQEVI